MRLIAEEYFDGMAGMDRIISSLTAAALTQIGRLSSDEPMPTQSPQRLLAFELRRLTDRHFAENWPVAHYLEALNTTPHLLANATDAAFGMSART